MGNAQKGICRCAAVSRGYLLLITLRHSEEVLSARDLGAPPGKPPDTREIKMAEQLVSALEDEFRPEDYADEYADNGILRAETMRFHDEIRSPEQSACRKSKNPVQQAFARSSGSSRNDHGRVSLLLNCAMRKPSVSGN